MPPTNRQALPPSGLASSAPLTKNTANAYSVNRIRCNAILPSWMDTPGEDVTQRRYHGATDGWLEQAKAAQPMGQPCQPDQLAKLASIYCVPKPAS